MNRADAAAILNIDAAASPEQTRKAYQELFTEHQFRLTNAPTPGLKSLYQGRLRELDEARDVLLTQEAADATSDLPTDQPSLPTRGEAASTGGSAPQREQSPPPPSRVVPQPPREKASVAEPVPEQTRPKPAKAGKSSRGKMIGAAIGAVIVIGGFLLFRSGKSSSSDCASPPCAASSASGNAFYPDSVAGLRENVVLARMELQRPEPNYTVVKKAVGEAEALLKNFPPSADADTSVAQLKALLSQQRSKLNRVCDALRKVAERHHEPAPPGCS